MMEFVCNILNFGILVSSTMSLRTSRYPDFSEEIGNDVNGILDYCITRQYLEALPNLKNWYFPNDQCMRLQNHAQVKNHSRYNMDVPQLIDFNEGIITLRVLIEFQILYLYYKYNINNII